MRAQAQHVPRGTMMPSFLVVTAPAYPFLSLPDEITKIFAIHILSWCGLSLPE